MFGSKLREVVVYAAVAGGETFRAHCETVGTGTSCQKETSNLSTLCDVVMSGTLVLKHSLYTLLPGSLYHLGRVSLTRLGVGVG